MTSAVGPVQIITPGTAAHRSNAHFLTWRDGRESGADQIDIRNTVDLVVIGNTAVAITKAAFCAQVQLSAGAGAIATERAPGRPAVARERPGDLAPARCLFRGCLRKLIGPDPGHTE